MTAVVVSTPSRLHFGLLRVHESEERSFGGLGMMIDQPRVELTMSAARDWRIRGPGASRAAEFARSAILAFGVERQLPAITIHIAALVPQHRGLGGGTQLALAIAAGVRELAGLGPGAATELAAAVGRGARSAVGAHGFVEGGLIWERGRTAGAALAELAARVPLPSAWRIVLVSPPGRRGLSGAAERKAFDKLPPVLPDVTRRLEELAEQDALPAAAVGDCESFGEAVYRYGFLAGECFAAVQGGPYAFQETAECVAALRGFGVRGVGQSSWGPTVFGITPNESAAAEVAARLRADRRWAHCQIDVVSADNRGAVISAPSLATPEVRPC